MNKPEKVLVFARVSKVSGSEVVREISPFTSGSQRLLDLTKEDAEASDYGLVVHEK